MASEIVKLVAKKANLSEPIAQIAVDTALNFVKTKLPANIGGLLDTFLGSSASATKSSKTTSKTAKKSDNPLGDIVGGALGGLLGGKK